MLADYMSGNQGQVVSESNRVRRIRRLFGSIKKKNKMESDDWTKEYDDVEKAYDKRMRNTWAGDD